MTRAALLLPLALAACGIPQDPEGTADRVRTEGVFRVGAIAGGAAGGSETERFLARLERRAGARAAVRRGAAEPLLQALTAGELDLVVGPMAAESPWEKKVHFLPALDERVASRAHVLTVAMTRNGENRWIALADRAAKP